MNKRQVIILWVIAIALGSAVVERVRRALPDPARSDRGRSPATVRDGFDGKPM